MQVGYVDVEEVFLVDSIALDQEAQLLVRRVNCAHLMQKLHVVCHEEVYVNRVQDDAEH